MNDLVKGHIIFDHDGTLTNTSGYQFQLFAGMSELLADLKKENFALYIWTARPRRSTIALIEEFNIAQFFNEIFCGDDGPTKPSTHGLVKLTGGIDKNKILHIGDSSTDIEGAMAYGIDVVGACWNDPRQKKYFLGQTPLVATDLEELRKIIRGKYV